MPTWRTGSLGSWRTQRAPPSSISRPCRSCQRCNKRFFKLALSEATRCFPLPQSTQHLILCYHRWTLSPSSSNALSITRAFLKILELLPFRIRGTKQGGRCTSLTNSALFGMLSIPSSHQSKCSYRQLLSEMPHNKDEVLLSKIPLTCLAAPLSPRQWLNIKSAIKIPLLHLLRNHLHLLTLLL